MKRFLLFLTFLVFAVNAYSQELTVKSFSVKLTDLTAMLDPVTDFNTGDTCALIKVSIAVKGAGSERVKYDGNIADERPVEGQYYIYMPAGSAKLTIKMDEHIPLEIMCSNYDVKLESKRTYWLVITEQIGQQAEKPESARPFVGVVAGYSAGAALSYGAMAGYAKKFGGFVKFRSNFSGFDSSETCDVNQSGFYYPTEAKVAVTNVTAGFMVKVAKPLYLYAGGGYGSYARGWLDINGQWREVKGHAYEGAAVTAGAMVRIGQSLGLTAGTNVTGFEVADFEFGCTFWL